MSPRMTPAPPASAARTRRRRCSRGGEVQQISSGYDGEPCALLTLGAGRQSSLSNDESCVIEWRQPSRRRKASHPSNHLHSYHRPNLPHSRQHHAPDRHSLRPCPPRGPMVVHPSEPKRKPWQALAHKPTPVGHEQGVHSVSALRASTTSLTRAADGGTANDAFAA
eukprot:scaffold270140_cov30-Tisochrysis_lutea.AAC.3